MGNKVFFVFRLEMPGGGLCFRSGITDLHEGDDLGVLHFGKQFFLFFRIEVTDPGSAEAYIFSGQPELHGGNAGIDDAVILSVTLSDPGFIRHVTDGDRQRCLKMVFRNGLDLFAFLLRFDAPGPNGLAVYGTRRQQDGFLQFFNEGRFYFFIQNLRTE